MPSIYRKPENDANLQMLLENRIRRHGIVISYYRGCRCERCVEALSTSNKKQYQSFKEAIKQNASLRSKYSIECRNWVEEFFPEVAEHIKNELTEENK